MGGARLHATDLIAVSEQHRVVFLWRDGELRTDGAFYGYLFQGLENDQLLPLVEFHLHPSHKGLHIKVPCDTSYDYRQRLLPGAPELALSSIAGLDPRLEADRSLLVVRFCKATGIDIGPAGALWN